MTKLHLLPFLLIFPSAMMILGVQLSRISWRGRADISWAWIGPGSVIATAAMVLQIVVDSGDVPVIGLVVGVLCMTACHCLVTGLIYRYGGTVNHWMSVPVIFMMLGLIGIYSLSQNDFGMQNVFLSVGIIGLLLRPVNLILFSEYRWGRLDALLRLTYLLLLAYSIVRLVVMAWIEYTLPDGQMMESPLWLSITLTGMVIAFVFTLLVVLLALNEQVLTRS